MSENNETVKNFITQINNKMISIGLINNQIYVYIIQIQTSQLQIFQGLFEWKDLEHQFIRLFAKNCKQLYFFLQKQFNGQNVDITKENVLEWKPKEINYTKGFRLRLQLEQFKQQEDEFDDQKDDNNKIDLDFFDSMTQLQQSQNNFQSKPIITAQAKENKKSMLKKANGYKITTRNRSYKIKTRSKTKRSQLQIKKIKKIKKIKNVGLKQKKNVKSRFKHFLNKKASFQSNTQTKIQNQKKTRKAQVLKCSHNDQLKNNNGMCIKCSKKLYSQKKPQYGNSQRRHTAIGKCFECSKRYLQDEKRQPFKNQKIVDYQEFLQSSQESQIDSNYQSQSNSQLRIDNEKLNYFKLFNNSPQTTRFSILKDIDHSIIRNKSKNKNKR